MSEHELDELDELNAHGLNVEQELVDILREEINKELCIEYGPDWKEKLDAEIIAAMKKVAAEMEEEKTDE